MTRHLLDLVALCCLPLTGCFGCSLGPSADECQWSETGEAAPKGSTIQVSGQALRADGTPMSGSVLMRDPATAGEVLGAIFTLGLSCLKDDLSGVDCGEWKKLSLDGQGGFSLSYPEADTHGTFFDKTFHFFAAAPAQASGLEGAAMVLGANFGAAQVKLPPLQLWEPEVHVTASAGQVQTTATPALATDGCIQEASAEVTYENALGVPVWTSPVGPVDARALEDLDGRVFVTTTTRWNPYAPVLDAQYTSGKVAFKGAAGPAPSRGAACSTASETYEAGKCPFTDGKYGTSYLSGGQATVDLGAARSVGFVALHGTFSHAVLSASTDGKAWTDLKTEISGRAVTVSPASGTSARYLKVAEPYDSQSSYQPALSLSGISAW